MLLRHWFAPLLRAVEDVDLVATFPFDVSGAADKFLPVLADGTISDGVTFDPDRTRHEGIWLESCIPGVRVFATAEYEDTEVDFHTDITFGPFPRPAPVPIDLPTLHGSPARVWACRPEAVAGHKVQALWHRGSLGWRPKDLEDLRLLLARVPMDPVHLRTALFAYVADVGGTPDDVRTMFGPESWWDLKMVSARWLDFTEGRNVPRELAQVVGEVNARLTPILEGER